MKIIFTDSSRSMMDSELFKMLVGNNIFNQEPIIHEKTGSFLAFGLGQEK